MKLRIQLLKSETHEGILGFFHGLTLDPSGFKTLAKSANSVSKMYPKYICFLLCPLTPPWSNHHHCSQGSAAASQTGSFFLLFLSPFCFPHKSSVRNWTTPNWLRSFRWLYIRCKIKSKLPKRCRIYLSNLQSSHPPSSSSCSQQRCQVHHWIFAHFVSFSKLLARFPLLSEKVLPRPSTSGRAFSTILSREAPFLLSQTLSFLQSTYV